MLGFPQTNIKTPISKQKNWKPQYMKKKTNLIFFLGLKPTSMSALFHSLWPLPYFFSQMMHLLLQNMSPFHYTFYLTLSDNGDMFCNSDFCKYV
jgi:hypothetical protein